MQRRVLLKLAGLAAPAFLAPAAGCTAAPEMASLGPCRQESDSGSVFYVSPSGNDANSGRATDAAWSSINQVNAGLADGTVVAGDSVVFESGGTFFGKIRPKPGTAGKAVRFGSYSTGAGAPARPVISSYKILGEPAGWVEHSRGVWRIDLSNGSFGRTHTGYDGAQGGGTNIGFLLVDGAIHGRRVWRIGDLRDPWDFWCSGTRLHVRSDRNPALSASDIRAACDEPCFELADFVDVVGLRFEGGGGHGVGGTATGVRVRGNEFTQLGGASLSGTTRYGNGVEFWVGSADSLVENNVFSDVYDSAMTLQGRATASAGSWSNIAFRGNTTYRCGQSIEFWSSAEGGSGPGFVGCLVEENLLLHAGYGWSAAVRPDTTTMVHVLTYDWDLPADIRVRGNVAVDGRSAYRSSSTPPRGLACSENVVVQRSAGLLRVGDPETVEQWRDWEATPESDAGSVYRSLPADAPVDLAGTMRLLRAIPQTDVLSRALTTADLSLAPCAS